MGLYQPSSVGLRLFLWTCAIWVREHLNIRSGKSSVGLGLFQVGLRARSDILDLSFLSNQMGCGLVSICRIDNEINKSVFHFTDLKVQAHGHKVETSRFQDRHHPMKGSHVHRTQRRFLLITGTGKV